MTLRNSDQGVCRSTKPFPYFRCNSLTHFYQSFTIFTGIAHALVSTPTKTPGLSTRRFDYYYALALRLEIVTQSDRAEPRIQFGLRQLGPTGLYRRANCRSFDVKIQTPTVINPVIKARLRGQT